MKKKILIGLLGSGWVFLATFLLSGYFFNKFSLAQDNASFRPVEWGDHVDFLKGALQCNLVDENLLERKKVLKEKIFSKVSKKEVTQNGLVYHFKDEGLLLNNALEFVQKEKDCCPFFKFDISILPYGHGFAIQISGSEEALDMLKDFENNDY